MYCWKLLFFGIILSVPFLLDLCFLQQKHWDRICNISSTSVSISDKGVAHALVSLYCTFYVGTSLCNIDDLLNVRRAECKSGCKSRTLSLTLGPKQVCILHIVPLFFLFISKPFSFCYSPNAFNDSFDTTFKKLKRTFKIQRLLLNPVC